MHNEFRIMVTLAGELEYHLCTVYSAEAVGAIVSALAGAAKPAYYRVSVVIAPMQP